MPIEDKLEELEGLVWDMLTHFRNHKVAHIRIGDRHTLKWAQSKLDFAVEHTDDRFMVHGRVLASAGVIHARTSSYFTFFPTTVTKVGFDIEISNAQELKDASAELKKLWQIQFYKEREGALAE